jgi:hypothetical protein
MGPNDAWHEKVLAVWGLAVLPRTLSGENLNIHIHQGMPGWRL